MAFGDFTVDRNDKKYVLGSGGTIVEYAEDEPAFEFNADGSYKGLLVEPAATNICLQSEDIDTTWAANVNATPTQSTEETPDGDTSSKYIKLVDNNTGGGATGEVRINQSITVVAETKYTASVFLKADGLNWARLMAFGTGGVDDNPSQQFDLDNGVLGTGTTGIQDATIEEYPNDWYRCSITWTQGAGDTSFGFRINVSEADNDVDVALDGNSSIFVWGAQVEEGPIATSYIPTTTASVTRNKDDITQTSASSLIGQTEGTLYLEVDWRQTGDITLQRLLSVNDGSGNNRVLLYGQTTNVLIQLKANNNIVASATVSASGFTGIQKFALAYANGDQELYRNGSSIATTTGSLAALATLTDIDLGQGSAGENQANMWIRSVALFTRRLSDAEAQALTTL